MDMISKVAIGLGGLGVAVVTGAAIQASIDERENNRKEMRNRISDLESKCRQMDYDIETIKKDDDRQDERIKDVQSRVFKLETKQVIEKT